jgi:sirohydrochlorin cobaltochelatase
LKVADEITAAFWKETPSFATVLDALAADDITVVPLFTANGYFTQTVIPAEMRLTGAVTERDGRIIRDTPPLGDHPYLQTITLRRVEDAKAELGVEADQFAIAVIGHSTKRNPDSRRAAEAQADYLHGLGIASEVVAVYLDDAPEISDIYTLTSAKNIIAVPYFLANGSHTTIDVPGEIGLQNGQSTGEINGRRVIYTPSVGAEDGMIDAILDLAHRAGAPLREPSAGSAWDCFPKSGRDQLYQALRASTISRFGELAITPSDVRVQGDKNPTQRLDSISALRSFVRDHPFRPLPTSRDLPRGWYAPYDPHDPAQVHAILETIYPGAVADWAKGDQFEPTPFDAAIARQTGQYRGLIGCSSEKQAHIAAKVCTNCVRTPTWLNGKRSEIPCKEPCNLWLVEALNNP